MIVFVLREKRYMDCKIIFYYELIETMFFPSYLVLLHFFEMKYNIEPFLLVTSR
jgi:hypothetical protein